MAQIQPTAVIEALSRALPRDLVEREARRHQVLVRTRKIQVYALVCTLVLSFQAGAHRTLASLQRSYERLTGTTLARSAFYARMEPELAKLLHFLARVALSESLSWARGVPAGVLQGFKELLAVDGTVLHLHRFLEQAFPASRTNSVKAAAKLHMLMNVQDGTARQVQLTPDRCNERSPWKRLGPWIKGALLLFDLGYFSYLLFDRIDRMGGFFLTRLKANANPKIVKLNRSYRGRSIPLEGRMLRDVLPALRRKLLDAEVEVCFSYRAFGRPREAARRTFRLIAVFNEETKAYHIYLTNVPPDRLDADDVTRIYALRWQIEILFKTMKTHGHFDQLPTSKQHVLECLIWASILAVTASQALLLAVRRALPKDRRVPLLRWAAIFGQFAGDLLRLLVHPSAAQSRNLVAALLKEAPDPNRRRADCALDGLVA